MFVASVANSDYRKKGEDEFFESLREFFIHILKSNFANVHTYINANYVCWINIASSRQNLYDSVNNL